MQALPHHQTALLAGDNGGWGVGATPSLGAGLSHYLFLFISKQLTLLMDVTYRDSLVFMEASYKTKNGQPKCDCNEIELDQ